MYTSSMYKVVLNCKLPRIQVNTALSCLHRSLFPKTAQEQSKNETPLEPASQNAARHFLAQG